MPTRLIFFLSLLAVCGVLGFSLYLQFYSGILPCPLCTLQRIAFAAIAFLLFIGTFFGRRRFVKLTVSFLVVIFSILGFTFAARQTWLQLFPSASNAECGVSLQYMMSALPWHQVIEKIFSGSAECAERTWGYLGLSMPEWSVICFSFFFTVGALMFIREWKRKAGK